MMDIVFVETCQLCPDTSKSGYGWFDKDPEGNLISLRVCWQCLFERTDEVEALVP